MWILFFITRYSFGPKFLVTLHPAMKSSTSVNREKPIEGFLIKFSIFKITKIGIKNKEAAEKRRGKLLCLGSNCIFVND
jgi:hypothetical protein